MESHSKKNTQSKTRSWLHKVGWGILLALSILMTLAGLSWFTMLPEMASENIAKYGNLEPGYFLQGNPAFEIITMIARGYGAGYAALGLMAFLVGLEGYRNGTRWAWTAMWVFVLAFAVLGGTFVLAGESNALSFGILLPAGIAALCLLLVRKSLASR